MRITRIMAYQADLHYAGRSYSFSKGRAYSAFPTTVVVLETDAGLSGYGEICPCGPAYMPGYADGVLPALAELAPHLIGQDPRQIAAITRTMDAALHGHGFAKTPVDLACWDLLGKASGQPVHVLLGGKITPEIPLHRVVPLGSADEVCANVEALRKHGFRHFQIKLGLGVAQDIAVMSALAETQQPGEIFVGDANGAWRRDEAVRVSAALSHVDCYLEQPCTTYEDCRSIRGQMQHPIKLDENLEDLSDVRRAISDGAMEAAAIKLSKFGGITKSRIIRDLCADAGVALTIEDAWGSGITAASIAHLAVSTPPETLLNGTDLHEYNSNSIAIGGPSVSDGTMTVSDLPGLGVEPDFDALGNPAWTSDRCLQG